MSKLVAYWEPPEAQDEFFETLLAWRDVLIAHECLLTFFYVSAEDKYFYGDGMFHNATQRKQQQPPPLPIRLPPSIVEPTKDTIKVGIPMKYPTSSPSMESYSLTNQIDWDILVHVYSSAQFVPGTPLWNYLVKHYQYQIEREFLWDIGDDFLRRRNSQGFYPLRDTYYAKKQREVITTWDRPVGDWLVTSKQKYRKERYSSFVEDYVIRSDIRAGVPYQFPDGIYLTQIEHHLQKYLVRLDGFPIKYMDSQFNKAEEAIRKGLLRELSAVLVPHRQRATFYFDMEAYKRDYREKVNENDNHNGMWVYENHWIGPYYHDENGLWKDLLFWAKRKILQVDKQSTIVKERLHDLADCYQENQEDSFPNYIPSSGVTYDRIMEDVWYCRNCRLPNTWAASTCHRCLAPRSG